MSPSTKLMAPGTRRRLLPWPKRVDVALLCFIAMLIAYCDRVNMSVSAPILMRNYGWDTARMGWILSAFFFGYTGFMIPAGMLADRFGPKRVFACNMAWWSVFTWATPFPSSVFGLSTIRTLMGIGEAGTLPSMNGILVRWFPANEYSRVTGFCWSGGYAGPIIGFPLATAILQRWGWKAIFYSFAVAGFAWIPVWLKAVEDKPEQSAGVSPEELDHIRSGRPEIGARKTAPWGILLSSRAVWALLALHFSSNWFSYVMLSWLPTYLVQARGFSLSQMAIGSSLPYVSALVSTNLFGSAIDKLTVGRDRTLVRKMFLIPYALSGVALMAVTLVRGEVLTVMMLCVAMALLTAATPVYASNSLDIAPSCAGTVVAVQACVANIAGILAPVVVGYAAKAGGWSMAFALTAGIVGMGIFAFAMFGTAKRVI